MSRRILARLLSTFMQLGTHTTLGTPVLSLQACTTILRMSMQAAEAARNVIQAAASVGDDPSRYLASRWSAAGCSKQYAQVIVFRLSAFDQMPWLAWEA